MGTSVLQEGQEGCTSGGSFSTARDSAAASKGWEYVIYLYEVHTFQRQTLDTSFAWKNKMIWQF